MIGFKSQQLAENYVFSIRHRDENGSQWLLKVPSAQGAFDLEINGYFLHDSKTPKLSSWDLFTFHKSNGMEATAEVIENLIGHNCRDRATEVLDNVLSPIMEADYELWLEEMEAHERGDAKESTLQNRAYEKSVGF